MRSHSSHFSGRISQNSCTLAVGAVFRCLERAGCSLPLGTSSSGEPWLSRTRERDALLVGNGSMATEVLFGPCWC